MSSYSKSMVSAKEYLKIDPFVLRGEIVTEVSIPQNFVHVVMVVAQILAQIASSCHRQVFLLHMAAILTALLTGTEFISKCTNCSNHVNRRCPIF